ncbi:unnamed protein product [Spirodela intermedia]|uniref:Uncharacterized protein n=2 Tax=Spirodela intermedia TaxID=51605 RepID=A0A7I8JRI5_SPIIN|nr:unnamed protein product [Spirodela intermedia]CAA6672744.1 unnamed protein product [Spirodela intermedia]CAA7409971.1 unnamed protein product [Spirodela intermedia]
MVEGHGHLHDGILTVLVMVMAVDALMASMRPSMQLDMETWSIQMLEEPKMEMPSPSLLVRRP